MLISHYPPAIHILNQIDRGFSRLRRARREPVERLVVSLSNDQAHCCRQSVSIRRIRFVPRSIDGKSRIAGSKAGLFSADLRVWYNAV
jgi:hypothetical protein